MGRFTSGVTIVTALRADIKYAMTATAVSSVSLEPPLILVCVSKTSRFHKAIIEIDTWAISLLAADQVSSPATSPTAAAICSASSTTLTTFLRPSAGRR